MTKMIKNTPDIKNYMSSTFQFHYPNKKESRISLLLEIN